jgi:hypothetical protein
MKKNSGRYKKLGYQMHCPKCHHEWEYDSDYCEKNITNLGLEIKTIINQLAEHNLLPKQEQYAKTDWWRRAKFSLSEKQKELAELKAFKKANDQQVMKTELEIIKSLIKEQYGKAAFKELIEQAEKEMEAYKISGLMRQEYSRSSAKANVTSINKI